MDSYKDTFVSPEVPISEAIGILEQTVQKICLVVDGSECLLGTITDGDIRRGLLASIPLNAPLETIMNPVPRTTSPTDDRKQILVQMTDLQLRHIPIVDPDSRVVGLITLTDLMQTRIPRDNWVVLMAGGIGNRLKPLTDDTPKPLLKVGTKPLLETIVEAFTEYEFRRFYISINYRAEMIKEHFGDGSRWNAEIRYLEEEDRMGTAGPLSLIEERPKHPLVVMNGDLLTKVNFDHLLTYHQEHEASATMCIREYDFQVPYGVVEVADNHISSIDEKPIHKFFVSAGIHVIEPEVIDLIPKNTFYDMPDLFLKLSEAGTPAAVFPILEYWLDVGQLDDYRKANGDFFEHFEAKAEPDREKP